MKFDEAVKSDGGNTMSLTLADEGDGTMSMELDPGKMTNGLDIVTALLMGAHNVFMSGGGDNEGFLAFAHQRLAEITGSHSMKH